MRFRVCPSAVFLIHGAFLIQGAILIHGATTAAALGAKLDWSLGRADCEYLKQAHEKIAVQDQKFSSVEALEVRAGHGTYVYAERSVEPSLIIDDLRVSVWVRSDREGIRILGRVVLPNSIDPHTGRPDTLLIPGETYEARGEWRELTLANAPKRFQNRLRVLRARLKRPVDERGAYLDAAVLNVYGGPGNTQVWMADVHMRGSIQPPKQMSRRPGQSPLPQRITGAGPELRVSRLSVDGKPFFPRIIDHQGEPFELLSRLGFNTIHLPQLPTQPQQDEAVRLGLWLICQPPKEIDERLSEYPVVLAWHLGDDVSRQAGVRRRVDALRRYDSRTRVLVGGASEYQWIASRQVDVLLRERAPIGTSFALSDYGRWLDQTSRLVRPGTPFWARIQTELPRSIVRQASLLGSSQGNARVELEQIRQLALSAIAAGSRGLWFRSQSRLDAPHDDARHRRLILERLNLEISLFAPWVMGGHRVGDVPGNNPRRRIVALTTERSRLLIPTQHHEDGQYVSSASKEKTTLVVAGVPDSTGVFLLSPIGLLRLPHRRISGGIQIIVDPSDSDTSILMTENGLDASHLHQQIDKTKTRAAILEYQIARRALDDLVARMSSYPDSPVAQRGVNEARDHLLHCQSLLETGDVTDVFKSAQEAYHAVARVRHHIWKEAVTMQRDGRSHPTSAAFQLLPTQSTTTASADPGQYLWPGGGCEDLNEMIRMGWRQHQSAPPGLATYIALSPRKPRAGNHCLRIRVVPRSEEAGEVVVESPPVRVESAAIAVRKGQRIHISGWVRIDQPIKGSLDGLMISDSIGGPDLALRLKHTKGWRRFDLIRAADRDEQLKLTFALSGIGEVWLDDLRATPEDPPRTARGRTPRGRTPRGRTPRRRAADSRRR